MEPARKWLEEFEKKKKFLVPETDLNEYFTASEAAGMKIVQLPLGKLTAPTGKLLVRDPFLTMEERTQPFFQKVSPGLFPVVACAVLSEEGAKYAAVKVDFTGAVPMRYEEAMIGNEAIKDMEKGDFFGIEIDSGIAAVFDEKGRDALITFMDKWEKKHPEENIYHDYFSDLFERNAISRPDYQSPGGDWIDWEIPGSRLMVPFFKSGFGPGCYPVYFGYDEKDEACCLIIHFINIVREYGIKAP